MNGYQMSSAIVMLGCLALSLGTPYFLFAKMGLLGIAISYAMANFVGSVILWLRAKQVTSIDCSIFATLATIRKT